MKTIKTLTTKKYKNLTSFEMVKIVGGENGSSNENQNTSNSSSTNATTRSDAAKNTIQNIR